VEAEKREHDEKRAVEAAAKAELAAAQARAEQRARYTLSALLETYVDHLEHVGRSSHRDARSIFKLHVEEAFPEIAGTPAAMVTDEQVADMQRRLVTAGKGRTANKLRSYIGAAYQCALRARTSSTLPTEFKPFQIRVNPAALTARESKFDRADKRPLSVDELRIYWSNIKHTPGKVGASLRLHLLTGGQRIAQFARIKNADVSDDTLVLFDGKGRPGSEPRKHIVPLIPAASECVAILRNENEFLLSTDDGKTSLSPTTLSGWSQDVPHRIANFQLKRVRSGIETALAAARVNKDDRGHLQSHGLTGVQAKHYDDHDYVEHKREALETLFRVLEGTDAQAPQRSTVPRSERRRRRKARMARSAPYDDLDKLVRDAPGQPSEA
jgi:integrase